MVMGDEVADQLLDTWLVNSAMMLLVNDIAESISFYRDKLGFIVQEQKPDTAILTYDPLVLYLVTEESSAIDQLPVALRVLNTEDETCVGLLFQVTDCHAVYNALLADGVRFLSAPGDSLSGVSCATRDPDGYLIKFTEL